MNNYLITLARRASGEVSGAVEPPARLTFIPDDDRSAEPAEPSSRYPPAFEASTVGRGAGDDEDTSRSASDRRSQAPGGRLVRPPSMSGRSASTDTMNTETPRDLPEGTRIERAPSENRGSVRSTDRPNRPGIGREEGSASSPDRTDDADPGRSTAADETSRLLIDPQSAGRAGNNPSPVVQPPGTSDRPGGLSSHGQTSPGGDRSRAARSVEAGSEVSGSITRSDQESEPQDGAADIGAHSVLVEPRNETDRFVTTSRGESEGGSGRSSVAHPNDQARRPQKTAPDLTMQAAPPDRSFEDSGSRERSEVAPSVEVHIGTIELRGAQTGSPEQNRSQPDKSAGPRGFDDYAAQRRYEI